jgi:hypothetical protein
MLLVKIDGFLIWTKTNVRIAGICLLYGCGVKSRSVDRLGGGEW